MLKVDLMLIMPEILLLGGVVSYFWGIFTLDATNILFAIGSITLIYKIVRIYWS